MVRRSVFRLSADITGRPWHATCRGFFFGVLKEPNSLVDHYTGGHGMRFGLEDQKPQLSSPQSPPAGAFLLGASFDFIVPA